MAYHQRHCPLCGYNIHLRAPFTRQVFDDGETAIFTEQLGVIPVLVGIAVATISAALAVRWLVNFLTTHGLAVFGWYRIALCATLGVLWLTGVVSIG